MPKTRSSRSRNRRKNFESSIRYTTRSSMYEQRDSRDAWLPPSLENLEQPSVRHNNISEPFTPSEKPPPSNSSRIQTVQQANNSNFSIVGRNGILSMNHVTPDQRLVPNHAWLDQWLVQCP